ncbi:MAG TPA: MFS transporter [Mycobacteriales bacterium]|nr:MFS transporter [Mycobacteriales bacterium]
MSTEPVTSPRQVPAPAGRSLAVLLVGAFMALLDTTIVNVALPSVQQGIGASSSQLEWVVSGYLLALGLALIPAGRIGDRIGHHRLYVAGLACFTAASLACGLARSPGQLIAARVVQGLGAGVFFPAIAALIQLLYAGPARGKAFGALGAVIGLSTALGPLAGGLLIQVAGADDGWRWVFLVNVPIGLVGVPLAWALLPRDSARHGHRQAVDGVGVALLTAALLALLVPLIEGQRRGWPAWTYATLAASAVLLVVLGWWLVRVERRGGDPLVSPRLLRQRSFAAGTVLALVYFAGFTSVFFALSILWQTGLGHSALSAGLVLLPFPVGSLITAAFSDRFSARLGRTVLVLGCSMLAAGLAAVLVILEVTAPSPAGWQLVLPLAIAGLGNGLFIAPNIDFVLSAVPPREAGAASGVLNTGQRIGSSIGIAVIGTILFGTLHVAGPQDVARAFIHSAELATGASVAMVLVALALIFALPRRLKHAWQ